MWQTEQDSLYSLFHCPLSIVFVPCSLFLVPLSLSIAVLFVVCFVGGRFFDIACPVYDVADTKAPPLFRKTVQR